MYDRNDGYGDEHNSPWQEIDVINEDGDEETICGCSRCQRMRKREYLESHGDDRRDE